MPKGKDSRTRAKATDGGWLRLHRKMRRHPRYKNSGYVHLWVHLLLSAEFKERTAMFDGETITLNPGQLIKSRRELADETGLSYGNVSRIINDLRTDQQIDQRTCNKNSMFTVLKWGRYQNDDPPAIQPLIHQRSTADPRLIHQTQKRQAGVHKNDAKKPRSKEGGERMDSTEALTFAPLSSNLFPDEYRQLKDEAERQIELLKAGAANWLRGDKLKESVIQDIEWLKGEELQRPASKDGLQIERERLLANPANYIAQGLTDVAKARVEAWRQRIKEIEAALSGRTT